MNMNTKSVLNKKNLYFKILIFAVIVFSFDFIVGHALEYFYFSQKFGTRFRTTYAMEYTNEDVLIFGSSRASHHYHPASFENKLYQTFYNVGRDGNFLLYHYAILESTLKRYSPKVIILDFNIEEFNKEQGSYDRLSSLLPYYKKHPEVMSVLELRSPYEKLKLLSNIYPFNSMILDIAAGNIALNQRDNGIKGYLPLKYVCSEEIKEKQNEDYGLDTNKITIYKKFIAECKKANIKLYIVCSPYYIKYINEDKSLKIAKAIANSYGIPFLDYSQHPSFFTNRTLFADDDHLNDMGARMFSDSLISVIR